MDTTDRNQLLEQFSNYLDSAHADDIMMSDDDSKIDLFALFTELAALKNEVKRESRQVKDALDQFRQVFSSLEERNQAVTRELESCRKARSLDQQRAIQPLLIGLLEIRDRLEEGITASTSHAGTGWRRFFVSSDERIQSLHTGQEMTLRRLDQILAQYHVEKINAIGEILDPQKMRAIATETHSDKAQGVVISVLRHGFVHAGEILRVCEVIVNRKEETK